MLHAEPSFEGGLKACSDGHCWLAICPCLWMTSLKSPCFIWSLLSKGGCKLAETVTVRWFSICQSSVKVCLDGHNPLTCHLSDIWPSLWMTSLKSPCFMCSLLLKAIESLLRWSQSVDLSSVHAFEWQKSPCFIWDWKFAEMVTVGWLAICLSSDHAFEWLLSNHHASYGAFYWRKVESLLRWSHSVDLPSVCHLYTPLNNFYQITMLHMEPSIEGGLKICWDGHTPLICHLSVICTRLWITSIKSPCIIWSLLSKGFESLLRWSQSLDLPSVCHLSMPLNDFSEMTVLHMEPSIEEGLKVYSDGQSVDLPSVFHLSTPLNDFSEISMISQCASCDANNLLQKTTPLTPLGQMTCKSK